MSKHIQAKHIPDAEIVTAIIATRGRNGVPAWSTRTDMIEHLSAYPPKVVMAKLRSMIRRGAIGGCACGCRGDFETA